VLTLMPGHDVSLTPSSHKWAGTTKTAWDCLTMH